MKCEQNNIFEALTVRNLLEREQKNEDEEEITIQ